MWLSAGFIVAGLIGVSDLFLGSSSIASTLSVLLIPGILGLFTRASVSSAREELPEEFRQMSRLEMARYLWDRNPMVMLSIGGLSLFLSAILFYLRWG